MNKTQKGFALVEGLLIALIIAIIAGTGYYVWHSRSQTDKSLTNASNSSQSTATANKKSSTTNPKTTQKYFTIKEWGVRAPYDGSLTMEYVVRSNSTPPYALLSSTQLDASGPQCGRPSYYGGAIDRYKLTDEFLEGDAGVDSGQTAVVHAATLDKSEYGHVGDYYYFYLSPQAACGESQSSQDLQEQTQKAVKSIMAGLQAIPQ